MNEQELRMLRPVGAFDEAAAHALVASVVRFERGASVVIDLSASSDLQDHELAILASGLAGCGREVALRGLTRHHVRVLRYLGLDGARRATPVADGAAPEERAG